MYEKVTIFESRLYCISIEEHDKLELLLDATKERGKTLVELAAQINLILTMPCEYDEKASKKAFKGDAKEVLNAFLQC